MINQLLSLVAPHHCYGCGIPGVIICSCCENYILLEPFSDCVICGASSAHDNLCSNCKPSFDRAWAASRRQGELSNIINDYKFSRLRTADKPLARILSSGLPVMPENTVIVPIPTTLKNIRVRGYDHILLIAKKLSKIKNIPVACLLRRNNNTTQHLTESAKVRREQAKSFFNIKGTIDPDKTYLVIDDIFTTGSTIESACHTLKQAGTKTVYIAILARQ